MSAGDEGRQPSGDGGVYARCPGSVTYFELGARYAYVCPPPVERRRSSDNHQGAEGPGRNRWFVRLTERPEVGTTFTVCRVRDP